MRRLVFRFRGVCTRGVVVMIAGEFEVAKHTFDLLRMPPGSALFSNLTGAKLAYTLDSEYRVGKASKCGTCTHCRRQDQALEAEPMVVRGAEKVA